MARVYLATLRGAGGFEKKLVVKQIRAELATDDAFVKRFVAEAKTTVELSHPNIVPVYELGVEQGVYFLAMELCDGVTLAELLQKTGKLTPEEGAYVGIEICRALDYAHRKARVVHRDVTPRNVIIDEEGGVRLIDFGIAAPTDSGAKEVFGSPGHMSPEQFRGEEVGPSADVFSVATLLYEAWSSKPPFRRRTPEQSQAALFEPVAALSTFEPSLESLDALMASALAVNAADRPQSAEDFSRPLRRFIADRDLGDVTRKVGERVRELRAGSDPKVRNTVPPPETPTSLAPAANVTRTFATRPLESQRTPVRRSSKPPPADLSVYPATRRMNDDGGSWSTGGRRAVSSVNPRSSRGRAFLAGLLGFAIAGAAAAAWRYVEPPPGPTNPAASERLAKVETTRPSPTVAQPEDKAAVNAGPSFPTPDTPAAPASAAPALSASSAARVLVAPRESASRTETPPGAAAHLRILANPVANVEVDGRAKGAAPILDLAVSAGSHLVRLDCAALGEAVSQNVTVAAGETLTISGDFTGAHGRILVRRAQASEPSP